MSTQKKIIISLSSLCLAVVVALVAVIAVLATSKLSISSQIGVSYTAKDVNVTVSGEYAYKDDAFTSMGDSLTFHTSDSEQSGQFSKNDIRFTLEKPFIVLKYSFHNLSNKNFISIKTTVNQNENNKNVRVSMAYSKEALEPSSYGIIIGESLNDAVLGGDTTAYVYIRLSVINTADSATFTGNITFNLTRSEGEPTEEQGLLKPGMILSYGEYPQTFVGAELNEILVEEYNKLSTEEGSALTPTGKTYHTDSNKTTIECKEYRYSVDGQKYVMIESAKFYSTCTLSTGESSGSYGSQPMFFKVEPIQFKLMDFDGDNTLTIFSEYVLGSKPFNTNNNTWKDSALELFLNGQFIKESELEYNFAVEPRKPFALETTLKNNVTNNDEDGTGPDSTDRIWLPSLNDLQTWYQEDGIKYNTKFSYLARKATDFAMASYTYTSSYNSSYYGCYWLRSAGTSSSRVYLVGNTGYVTAYSYTTADYGFCPALKISLDRF